MFIKDEPHSAKKIAEGRWRIISAFSVEDQVLDRVLFYPWVKVEIRSPMDGVAKAGWAPVPAGYQRLVREFPAETSVAVDKSAWDWTMPDWVVKGYVDVKLEQCVNSNDRYERLVWGRIRQVLGPDCLVQEPNGFVWRQDCWGLMKSGFFLTLSMNSMAQLLQHALATERSGVEFGRIWAMGDDTIVSARWTDEDLAKYEKALATTGCVVKKCGREREFAGFNFVETGGKTLVVPLYPTKHEFSLRYLDEKVASDTQLAFQLLYALAGSTWIDRYRERFSMRLGLQAELWAKGLTTLGVLSVPPAFTWEGGLD